MLAIHYFHPSEFIHESVDGLRKEPMRLILLFLLLVAVVTAALAGEQPSATLLDEATGAKVTMVPANVMLDSALRMYCILGAIAAAFMSIWIYPAKSSQDMAGRVVVCGFSGICFTPALMHYYNITLSVDYVMGASAMVGICSWTIIQVIIPIIPSVITKWFTAKTQQP